MTNLCLQQGEPRFAILLTAFNGRDFLQQQIRSILVQERVNVRIYVSVDASIDGTEDFVDSLAKLDSRISVLPHGRRFGGAAVNFFRLLREVDFEGFDYIAFSDQDDIWLSDKLHRAHEMLVKTKADAYSSNVVAFWPSGKKKFICKSQPQRKWDFLFEAAGPGCTYVMSVTLTKEIQLFLRERWEDALAVGLHDWFSYAFARANGYKWIIDDYAGVLYRQHGTNEIGVNTGLQAFIYRVRKVMNGWGLGQAELTARLLGLQKEPFVQKWKNSRWGLVWLAIQFRVCRRRRRDQFLFAVSCILLSILNKKRL